MPEEKPCLRPLTSNTVADPNPHPKPQTQGRSKQMAQFPAPKEGILITLFMVSRDVERSRRFYVEVLGGEALLEGEPSIVALANGWITISTGGGPTEDKPNVTLEPPSDPHHASAFLNIRVADIGATYK